MAQTIDRDKKELAALRHIRNAIRNVKYGTVTIIVQDGVVIQIDRTEKLRINYSMETGLQNGDGI